MTLTADQISSYHRDGYVCRGPVIVDVDRKLISLEG